MGPRLREWRLQKGMSRGELAERAGLSLAAITSLELGRRGRFTRPETKEALTRALGLTSLELAGFPPQAGESGRMLEGGS